MKFKNTAKKTTQKKPVAQKPEMKAKDSSRKEEIREIVEETVAEVLKEHSEGSPSTTLREEKIVEEEKTAKVEPTTEEITPVLSVTPAVVSEESTVLTQTPPEGDSTIHTSEEEKFPNGTEVVPQESGNEASVTTTPIASTSAFSLPQPSVEILEDNSSNTSKKSSKIVIFMIFVLLGVVVGGCLWFATSHKMLNLKMPTIPGIGTSPKVLPTKAPSPTSIPTPKQIDLSQYKIIVLNGSGVAGEAAKVKMTLTNAGFTVSATGNASTSDFTETVISAKATVATDALAKLTQTLVGHYIVSSHTVSLDDSQVSDIIVTIGSSTK